MVVREKLYTVDEFWEIATSSENENRRLELEDGVIVEMGASSKRNTVTVARIIYFLSAFVIPNDLGIVTSPDAGFKIGTRSYRQPDAAFVSKPAANDLKGTYFTVSPDLAVEVVSEDEDIFKKAREYLRAGTKMVWAAYTDEKTVHVMRLDEDGGLKAIPFGVTDTLDGGDVLPGFSLPVKDIFLT